MSEPSDRQACEDWWATSIIEMRPGVIRYRGYAIEDLIGRISFPAMIWLMLRGELPSEGEAELLGTALMAAVDHGPQAPSIAIARMAATCGVGINNAMASAINVLGVTDPEGDAIAITIDSIFQDEEVDAPDSGNTGPDGQGAGTATAEVRAERVGEGGNGRVYHVGFTADDGHGGACSGEVLVGVPVSKKDTPVDDGALFDSTVLLP